MISRVESEHLVDLIYAAVLCDSGWHECLRGLGRAVGADRIGLFRHDVVSGKGDIEHAEGIEDQACSSYFDHYSRHNEWLRDVERLTPGAVLTGAEVVPVWEIVRTDFYRAWLRPLDVLHALLAVIARDGPALRLLIAMRKSSARPFAASERALAATLLPHLARAFWLAPRVREDRQRMSMLVELFNHAPQAILVVDRSCQIHLRNQAADELLAHDHGLRCMGARLWVAAPEENRRLRQLVAAKVGTEGPVERMLITPPPPEEGPLLLTVSPIASKFAEAESDEIPVATISTRCPARCKHLSAAQLRRLLPLTPAEAELAALILGGHGLLDSAAVLHISKNTARTHMKRIYSKIDIHRQPDLRRLFDSSVFEPNVS